MWGRPDILWGLLALAIPIALHLLQLRRYRRVAFSNVSFLKDVQKETQSRHRLRNLLILLARLLAFAALILAFADPMRAPENGAQGSSRQAVSIYLDTSPSMMAAGEMGPLIQEAKQKASALVEAFSETDKFHVFTSEFAGRDQRFLTQTEALERIASTQLSAHAPDLGAVMQRSLDQFRRAEGATPRAFWVTDMQKSSHDLLNLPTPDTSVAWHVLPVVGNDVPNVWIDSVWFDAPLALGDQPAALHVRIDHDAVEGVDDLPLTLRVDGVSEALGSFNLVPGLPTDTVLRFTHGQPGPHQLSVSLEDAPVRFDDTHHVGYDVQSGIDVFHWTEARAPFRQASQSVDQALESARPLIQVDRGTSLPSPQLLAAYDLVVADGLAQPSSGAVSLLAKFVEGGGSVMLVPDSTAQGMASLCEGLNLRPSQGWVPEAGQVKEVNWAHPLYKGVFRAIPSRVDWPQYDRILNRRPSTEEATLIEAANGMAYLSLRRGTEGQGDVYVLGTCLETGNLTRHGLFVPTLLRVAESSRHTEARRHLLGRDQALTLALSRDEGAAEGDLTWVIESADAAASGTATRIVPEVRTTPDGLRLGWGNALTEPGAYVVKRNDETVAAFGLNPNPRESRLDTWLTDEWRQTVLDLGWKEIPVWSQSADQVGRLVEQHIAGERLAWYFFLAALVALALETLLLRRWNKLFS